MAEPLFGVSGMKLKKISDPEEPIEFQLTIAFREPIRSSVEIELEAEELIGLFEICQRTLERHKLIAPASPSPKADPKPEPKPPAATKVKKRKPAVKAKKRWTLH